MRISAYDALLNEVCVGLGFCGGATDGRPLHVGDFIPETGEVTADDFVNWVLIAEGMDPAEEASLELHASLRDAFVRHMGHDVIDAQMLK